MVGLWSEGSHPRGVSEPLWRFRFRRHPQRKRRGWYPATGSIAVGVTLGAARLRIPTSGCRELDATLRGPLDTRSRPLTLCLERIEHVANRSSCMPLTLAKEMVRHVGRDERPVARSEPSRNRRPVPAKETVPTASQLARPRDAVCPGSSDPSRRRPRQRHQLLKLGVTPQGRYRRGLRDCGRVVVGKPSGSPSHHNSVAIPPSSRAQAPGAKGGTPPRVNRASESLRARSWSSFRARLNSRLGLLRQGRRRL